jgi:hypothetical protein
VVVGEQLAQLRPQVVLAPHEDVVEQFVAGGPDQALGEGVADGPPWRSQKNLGPTRLEHVVALPIR